MDTHRIKNYELRIKRSLSGLKLSHSQRLVTHNSQYPTEKGLTLIELLVAASILATLTGGVLLALNPFKQIEKGEDARRQEDLQQIKNALETYYHDHNCYPKAQSAFVNALQSEDDREWTEEGTVYMKEVPQDPTCGELSGACYQYITDTDSTCPQWNVLFGKFSKERAGSVCPLAEEGAGQSACLPTDYSSEWGCILSGAVNCSLVAQSGFGYDSGDGGIKPTGGASPTLTPMPSGSQPLPYPTIPQGATPYYGFMATNKNPYLDTVTFSPLWAEPDSAQSFYVKAEDDTADITSVVVHLFSDNLTQKLTLNFNGGTKRDGVWSGTIQADTYNELFALAIVGEDSLGNKSCGVITPRVEPGRSAAEADAICAEINGL